MNESYGNIALNGLWHNNPGLVQLLGLCPLLAVTGTLINGLGLGLATTMTLVISNLTVSLIRHWVREEIRIPVFVLVIACTVTAVELAMSAFFHGLYLVLGIFIPLIVTNCSIIGRAEAFASKNSWSRSIADGLSMGIGFTLVLVVIGAIRELIGHGTLFSQAELMFGKSAQHLTITLSQDFQGLLLAVLPPGAFLALGLLIALKNVIDKRLEDRALSRTVAVKIVKSQS